LATLKYLTLYRVVGHISSYRTAIARRIYRKSKSTKSTAHKSKSTCKKRNPTPATKSTATPPKANNRNPPALDGLCLRMALLRCHVQSSILHSERRHTSKSIGPTLGVSALLSVASAINPTWTAIEVNS